jgi:2-keto-4-pentenoate hydratase/2-oxohepta-3-ene-1,7-dioic acid hydratase in catechol pathway
MTHWVRFRDAANRISYGTLRGEQVRVHEGDPFVSSKPTGESVPILAVSLLTPCVPTKMVALSSNFHALAAKLGNPAPVEPLYFLKANSSFLGSGETIRKPPLYDGKVVFEGELGIVIGKRCSSVSEGDAPSFVFGYTCVNDVTAIDILRKHPNFEQWTRAKSFDTFGPFGPAIATDIDPLLSTVCVMVNGQERQNYPVADMVLPPARLVSLISHDMTLEPGDVISCGTSVGAGSMKSGSTVSVSIDGIGTLLNRFE